MTWWLVILICLGCMAYAAVGVAAGYSFGRMSDYGWCAAVLVGLLWPAALAVVGSMFVWAILMDALHDWWRLRGKNGA